MRRRTRIKNQSAYSSVEFGLISACLALMLVPATASMTTRIENELAGVFCKTPVFDTANSVGGAEGSTHELPGPPDPKDDAGAGGAQG